MSDALDLLFVDDNPDLRDLVQRALAHHRVRVAESVAAAEEALTHGLPAVLILDVALPDGNGVALCRRLRARGLTLPILLLTAHGEVRQRVEGLDAGADDFLAKPFAMAELRARIRALGRRGTQAPVLRPVVAGVELDLRARQAWRGDAEVPLTGREWEVLGFLLQTAGELVPRDTLLAAVWGDTSEGARNSLEVIVGRIRRKLGSEAVRTVRGRGYVVDVA